MLLDDVELDSSRTYGSRLSWKDLPLTVYSFPNILKGKEYNGENGSLWGRKKKKKR